MVPRSTAIRVDPQFLINLSRRLNRVASDLRRHSAHAMSGLASAPPVEDAYNGLSGRWDFNRGRLANSLDDLAEAFQAARQAFVEADQDMASQLED